MHDCDVAQLAERGIHIADVGSSILPIATSFGPLAQLVRAENS